MPDPFFVYYANIGDTSIGDPVHVTVRKLKVSLDYVLSVQEILFLESILRSIGTICEIGAGFGRTCHAIIRNFRNITEYTIVDIRSCLDLSRKYLKEALSAAEFKRIAFVENTDAPELQGTDLFLNIDSMAEMDEDVVNSYLSLISSRGCYFYSRNPVCKYHPSMVGLNDYDEIQLASAMSSGVCRELINIFDDEALQSARGRYLERYCPTTDWALLKSEVSFPWQYYHHALYKKELREATCR